MTSRVAQLTRDLLRIESVTPNGQAVFDYLDDFLKPIGFNAHNLDKNNTQNRYYKRGDGPPHLCFVGHVDVVPAGIGWQHEPFSGDMEADIIYGRGAVDMKGAIAAFLAVIEEYSDASVALLLTSDEEGPGDNGIITTLDWLKENNEVPELFLVGEPTSQQHIGDTIKVGRRGSFHAKLKIIGKQGHVAYPNKALNPAKPLGEMIKALYEKKLDTGDEFFQPSNLEVISVNMPYMADNIIPHEANIQINIRFNPQQTPEALESFLKGVSSEFIDKSYQDKWQFNCSSLPFQAKQWTKLEKLRQSIKDNFGILPALTTDGGTSDARHVQKLAPVIELGLKNNTAHKVDEFVSIEDLERLQRVYSEFLSQ